MGIYDRDYYRKEAPSFLDALIPQGLICKWLIAINVAMFILQMLPLAEPTRPERDPDDRGPRVEQTRSHPDEQSLGPVTDALDLRPESVLHGQVWRLLTYAFLHADFWHIFFNMLFLWWFGSDLEQLYGSREFLLFYLTAALCGGVVFTALHLTLLSPAPCLGASGAVTALLVLCACHFPHRRILIFYFLPVPIWLFAIFNVARDGYTLLLDLRARGSSGVAVDVHLAGAAFAFAYYKAPHKLADLLAGVLSWRPRLSRPRAKLYRPPPEREEPREPVPVAAAPAERPVDEHFEAKLDAVLEKIARSGKESLTAGEQEILMRASEIYKKKRS